MFLPEIDSTSSLIRREYMDREHGFAIRTDFQTGGRGQQGNSWESERGSNLLFSMLLHPHIPVVQAWDINIHVAMAIVEAIEEVCPEVQGLSIKWPNDIYVGDYKVCGTLIENFVGGAEIASSIVGIGLNINQRQFVSNAPNPISLLTACGKQDDMPVEPFYERICEHILQGTYTREQYMARLYRNDGRLYRWESEGEEFEAQIATISPLGELVLQKKDGTQRAYRLKEVKHLIRI